jgi:hypothetical protein
MRARTEANLAFDGALGDLKLSGEPLVARRQSRSTKWTTLPPVCAIGDSLVRRFGPRKRRETLALQIAIRVRRAPCNEGVEAPTRSSRRRGDRRRALSSRNVIRNGHQGQFTSTRGSLTLSDTSRVRRRRR